MASNDDENYLLDDVSEDGYDFEENACDDDDDAVGVDCEGAEKAGEETEAARLARKRGYVLEKEDDVRRRQADALAKTSELLSVPPGFAAVLLRHFQWDAERLQDGWFSDNRRVRDAVGLLPPASGGGVPVAFKFNDRRRVCGICFESFRRGRMRSVGCAHYYCDACWRGYLRAAVEKGPARCLSLRCPDPPCQAAVVRELVDEVADDEAKERYATFVARSFVEEGSSSSKNNNRLVRWCPGPGCAYVVRSLVGSRLREAVVCACGHAFCFACGEEAHRPATCETARAWCAKNSADAESLRWVVDHTKHCPRCRGAIQKNRGCNHMRCLCGHQFCWICLGDWATHAGGNYNCHRYEKAVAEEGFVDEDAFSRRQQQADQASSAVARYVHYYERWTANGASGKKAREDLDGLEAGGIEAFAAAMGRPPTEEETGFLKAAYAQIVESRRVLRWTYAYVYYLDPEREAAKREFCEFIQGEAESSLERLHHCAEQEWKDLLIGDAAVDYRAYDKYRTKLAGLTAVTRNYFDKLVTGFESGMTEVQV
ncbi:hypothetical protein EJB05_43969, partial [Eragrostis curvula]